METAIELLTAGVVGMGLLLWIFGDGKHPTIVLWLVWFGFYCLTTSAACWWQQHIWNREEQNSKAEPPRIEILAPPDADAADKADYAPKDDEKTLHNTPQPTNDPEPPAPDLVAQPLHENPTPEYIETLLLEHPYSYESRKDVTQRLIGKTVHWDGRIARKNPSPNSPWILVSSGLEDKVGMPKIFSVNVELPEHVR